jgi:agmatinase
MHEAPPRYGPADAMRAPRYTGVRTFARCPATGTPEVGGLLPDEALAFVRSLAGLDFRAFDVVEVSPQLDGPAQVTAMLAANVAHEMLGLRLLRSSST